MNTKTTAVKQIVSVLLLMVLLIASIPSALADATYFMNTGKNDKVDIYVRVFVPSDKTPKQSVGHYDLMIKGKLHLAGKNFTNPVFTYRTDGTLEVFSARDTKKVYPHSKKSDYYYGCHMYLYHMKVDKMEKVYDFISAVSNHIKSTHSSKDCKGAIICDLKGKFSHYKLTYVNCFLAVARWTNTFGNSKLMEHYNNYYNGDHASYLPAAVVKKHRDLFTKKF